MQQIERGGEARIGGEFGFRVGEKSVVVDPFAHLPRQRRDSRIGGGGGFEKRRTQMLARILRFAVVVGGGGGAIQIGVVVGAQPITLVFDSQKRIERGLVLQKRQHLAAAHAQNARGAKQRGRKRARGGGGG